MHLWELMPMFDVDFFWQRETTSRHPEQGHRHFPPALKKIYI